LRRAPDLLRTHGAGWDGAVDASAPCLRSVPAISNPLMMLLLLVALTVFLFLTLLVPCTCC
jgi:hypothetical protein